jgi:hypothetical protein
MFEYNAINSDAVESVELLSPTDADYIGFKQRLYDDSNETPDERQRMAESDATGVYTRVLKTLIEADDLDTILKEIVQGVPKLPDYIENQTEVREALLTEGLSADVNIKYGDTTPETRADCRYSKNDTYRDGDDALCCWECSSNDSRKPAKFDATDEPCSTCSVYTPTVWKLKKALGGDLSFYTAGPYGWLGEHFRDSELDVRDVQNRFQRAKDSRSAKVQLAFRAAFPDEEYYYQRAEALLRDIDSDLAEQSGPGSGGRKFEYDAIQQLDERFELRDEKVFKITFRDDAAAIEYSNFVSDPSEPTYKEADAIIGGDIGPIVVDIFTQRSYKAKREQVANYAELYEIATGVEPLAWAITDDTRAELLELDTLTGKQTDERKEPSQQPTLADFIDAT